MMGDERALRDVYRLALAFFMFLDAARKRKERKEQTQVPG